MPTSSNPTAERLVRTAAERTQSVVEALRDRASGEQAGTATVRQSITIESELPDLVAAARDPATLSTVLGEFGKVETTGDGTYRWTVSPVADGDPTTIDATLSASADHLGWSSTDGAAPPATLALAFTPAPQDRGTEVALRLELALPPGTRKAGTLAAGGLALKALHRFKALVRTGEVPTLKHNPAARNDGADHTKEG